ESDTTSDTQNIVRDSATVFTQMMNNPKTRIPAGQLRRSHAIAIIPSVIQAGFFFGGRRGTGVMMTHNADGTWSNPVFVNVTGGSFGLQIGAKSSDIVLVFPGREPLDKVISGGSLQLGGNVTGTAGSSEGRAIATLDDRTGGDKIYAYSRSEGLFGSASFEGAELGLNDSKDKEFYGREISPRQILATPRSAAPVVVDSLKQVLSRAEAGR
ncbi:MAG: lipid-binding SYLF domain-containing protein, partial [Thermosynechococcaceae cyanobacterium]